MNLCMKKIQGNQSYFYNEPIILFVKKRNYTKFPEFVYSWLVNFKIDNETKEVRKLDRIEVDL